VRQSPCLGNQLLTCQLGGFGGFFRHHPGRSSLAHRILDLARASAQAKVTPSVTARTTSMISLMDKARRDKARNVMSRTSACKSLPCSAPWPLVP